MPTFEIIKPLELAKTVSEISPPSKDQQEKELLEVKNEGVIRRPSFSLGGGGGEEDLIDEDDDGFKTPTSMDHKIPRLKQCPPAPMKLKSKSCPMKKKNNNKRKELQAHCFRIDLSKEIQLLFPPLVSDLGLFKKMKKSTQAA